MGIVVLVGEFSLSEISEFKFSSLSQWKGHSIWHFGTVPKRFPLETEIVILLIGDLSTTLAKTTTTQILTLLHERACRIRSHFEGNLLFWLEGKNAIVQQQQLSAEQEEYFQQALRLIALKFNASLAVCQDLESVLQEREQICMQKTTNLWDLLIWAGWDSAKRIAWINESFGAEELANAMHLHADNAVFLECILAKFTSTSERLLVDDDCKSTKINWPVKFAAQIQASNSNEEFNQNCLNAIGSSSPTKIPSIQPKNGVKFSPNSPAAVSASQKEAISNFFASLIQKTSTRNSKS